MNLIDDKTIEKLINESASRLYRKLKSAAADRCPCGHVFVDKYCTRCKRVDVRKS